MRKRFERVFLVLVLVLLLVACAPQTEVAPTPPDTPAPAADTPTTPVEPTSTSQPRRVILVVPPEADPARLAEVRSVLQTAAEERGLEMFEQATIELPQLVDGLAVVAVLSPDESIQAAANNHPQVQFVAIDSGALSPTDNLTVLIEADGMANTAFIAGYLAALQSEEYRIGLISIATPEGQIYREAFLNGVMYFCGACTPVFPPFAPYPIYAEVSENAGVEEVQQAVNELIANGVTMAHVASEAQSEAVFQYLSQNGIRIVGTDAPPAGLEGHWVASVILEPQQTLAEVIEMALDGRSLGEVRVSLSIEYSGISLARISHLEEILSKLESGEIDPVGRIE